MVKNLIDELDLYDEQDEGLDELIEEKEDDEDMVDILKPFLKKINKIDRTIEKRVDEQVEYKTDKIDAKITNKILGLSQQIQDKLDTIENGKDYVLTESDKKEIAKSIKVPVVEKVIEKIERVVEKPMITNEIKEVAITETAEQIVEKINTLSTDKEEYKIDAKHIKGLPEAKIIGSGNKYALNGVPAGGSVGQVLKKKGPTNYELEWADESGGGGGITETSTNTLTNKTLDDYTNFIHADGIHLRVKATESLVKGDVIKFVGFNSGEQAIEVAKRDALNVPAIGVIHTETMDKGDFGMAVSNGLFKGIDTSEFTEGQVLYPDDLGGFVAENPGGYAQQMAYVVRKHTVNGEIMINVGEGGNLKVTGGNKNELDTSNQTDARILSAPDNSGTIPLSVNNVSADNIGNIVLSAYDIGYDGPEGNTGDQLNAIRDDYTSKQDTGDFLNEYDLMWKGMMNNQIAWMLPTAGATTFGNTLRVRGPVTLSGVSANSSVDAITFSSTAVAGTLAFQRATALVIYTTQYRVYKRFDLTAITSASRMFTGFSGQFLLTAPTNVEPNTFINCIGICKLSTSNNLHLIHNDGTGTATTYDLGSSFVATTGFIYDLMIEKIGSTIRMAVQKTEIATGSKTVSGIYTATSDIPAVNLSVFMYITNNTSASIVGLNDYGTLAPIRL